MVEVKLGKWNLEEKRFDFQVKEIDSDSLRPMAESAHGLLTLIPRPEIMAATGKSHGALLNALRRVGSEKAGIKLPKRALPQEDREFGGGPNIVYYTPEHAKRVLDHYGFIEELDRTHRKLTPEESKRYFGTHMVSKLNKMLEDHPGEEDTKLKSLGLEVTRKTVNGQKLVLFKTQTPSYYYPRKLIDDPVEMGKWAAQVDYDYARRQLPPELQEHGIVTHMTRVKAVSYKRLRRWLEDNDAGLTINTSTGEVGKIGRQDDDMDLPGNTTGRNLTLVKPEKVKAFEAYVSGAGQHEGYTPAYELSRSLSISQPTFRKWVLEHMRGRYGEGVEVFGLSVNLDGETLLIENTLTPDEMAHIREAGKGKGLEVLERGLIGKMALEGGRRKAYHPEVQRLMDEGKDLGRIMPHNPELERWGVMVERIPPVEGSTYGPSYKLHQK